MPTPPQAFSLFSDSGNVKTSVHRLHSSINHSVTHNRRCEGGAYLPFKKMTNIHSACCGSHLRCCAVPLQKDQPLGTSLKNHLLRHDWSKQTLHVSRRLGLMCSRFFNCRVSHKSPTCRRTKFSISEYLGANSWLTYFTWLVDKSHSAENLLAGPNKNDIHPSCKRNPTKNQEIRLFSTIIISYKPSLTYLTVNMLCAWENIMKM